MCMTPKVGNEVPPSAVHTGTIKKWVKKSFGTTFSDTSISSYNHFAIKMFYLILNDHLHIIILKNKQWSILCHSFSSQPGPIDNGMQNYDYTPVVLDGFYCTS